MLKKIYNYFFRTHTNSILANVIIAIFGDFVTLGKSIDNDFIKSLNHSKSDCLNVLYNDTDVEYDSLIETIKKYSKKIHNLIYRCETELNEKNSIIEKLTNEIDSLNKNTYLTIDIELFKTITYKTLFIKEKTELELQNASDDVILNRFNNLINQETIYLQGLLDAIDYSKNKKSKAKSIYSQLEEAFLIKNNK